jgi:uncharacterized protein
MDTSLTAPTEKTGTSVIYKVFSWMTLGLVVSGLTAYWVATTPAIVDFIFGSKLTYYGLAIVEVGLVTTLSWFISKLSAASAAILFLLYSFINGLTLSAIIIVFTGASLASTFAITAGTFGLMALFGYTTGRDLSRWSSLLMMGLLGLVLAWIVNLFVGGDGLGFVLSALGVVIFTALTAYDIQKIKSMSFLAANNEARAKQGIFGALMLYLDFINIFLNLLRFTGRRR